MKKHYLKLSLLVNSMAQDWMSSPTNPTSTQSCSSTPMLRYYLIWALSMYLYSQVEKSADFQDLG
jgi:hypothetical protein